MLSFQSMQPKPMPQLKPSLQPVIEDPNMKLFEESVAFYGRGGSVDSMAYYNGGQVSVPIYNKSKPRDYTGGGYIEPEPDMTREQLESDSLKTKLEYGSLVVPKKYTPMVKKWMKENGLSWKGPKEKNSKNIQKAITQPGELVIDKLHVKPVIQFLKSQGINLPNT